MKGFQKLCVPRYKRYLFALLPFLALLLSLFLNQNSVYAASRDVVVDPSTIYLCGTSPSMPCYDYVVIHDCSFNSTSWVSFSLNTNGGNSSVNLLPRWLEVNQIIFSLASDAQLIITSRWSNVESCTFTFTDSLDFVPSGTFSITENGTYDVSEYQYADVDAVGEVIQGDYHDDLENLRTAIYTCGAVLLVLYFFYCIYRMIIRSTGGKR